MTIILNFNNEIVVIKRSAIYLKSTLYHGGVKSIIPTITNLMELKFSQLLIQGSQFVLG